MDEQILVVPVADLKIFDLPARGVVERRESNLTELLTPAAPNFQPRSRMEKDPSFKQLIPYCVLQCQGKYWWYTRMKGEGEARLQGKRSLGVGGHINSGDVLDRGPIGIVEIAARRELLEEVSFNADVDPDPLVAAILDDNIISNLQFVGLINDDSNEVGQVHLGILYLLDTLTHGVTSKTPSMAAGGFATLEELRADYDKFESWSQLLLDYL